MQKNVSAPKNTKFVRLRRAGRHKKRLSVCILLVYWLQNTAQVRKTMLKNEIQIARGASENAKN